MFRRRSIIGPQLDNNIRSMLAILLAGLVVFVLLIAIQPDTGYAATLKELNQKKTELQKQIEAKKKEAAEKAKQAKEQERIKRLHEAAVNKLANDIKVTEGKINQAERKITETEKAIVEQLGRIGQKEKEISQKKSEISDSAAELYIAQNGSSGLLAVIGSDNIGSALNNVAAFSSLADKLIEDADTLESQRTELLAIKAQLEQQQQDLESQKRQLAAYEKALGAQKGQKEELAAAAGEAQAKFLDESSQAAKVSEELKKQFATVAAEEAAMRRAASRRATASATRGDAPPSSYGLVWPVDGIITTYFGGKTPFQNFHTGFDIAGPAGDAIKASAAGSVTAATKMCCSDYSNTVDKSYGYGNYIMIQHDNGLVTLYGHLMEMVVTPGDKVERGQTIGYRGGGVGMAGSGWSTGPHLHYEVRDSQGPDDPGKYLP